MMHLVGLEQEEGFGEWLGDETARKYYRHLLLENELNCWFKQPSSVELERVY